MIRVIKRYGGGSRKLYDTEESRYVSLEEISGWIGEGQEIQVLDSATFDDVTSQILAQTLFEDHKRGQSILPTGFLHEVIRKGHQTFTNSLEQVQAGVELLRYLGARDARGLEQFRARLAGGPHLAKLPLMGTPPTDLAGLEAFGGLLLDRLES